MGGYKLARTQGLFLLFVWQQQEPVLTGTSMGAVHMLCPISESLLWGMSILVTHSPSMPGDAPFVMVKDKAKRQQNHL